LPETTFNLNEPDRSQRRPARLGKFTHLLVALLALSASTAVADDWPQWRGPDRNGRSAETGLLQSWPEGGPSIAWKSADFGAGYSSVAVADGRVFTLGDFEDGQYAIAVREDDGTPLWRARLGPSWDDKYLGPRSTPTIDGDKFFIVNTEGDVICLESITGKELWRKSLPKAFDSHMMQAMGKTDWKYAESLLVDGNHLIVSPGVQGAGLAALDKRTGREIWRTDLGPKGEEGIDGAAYSSVVISHGAGVKQYVQFIGRGVIGVEAESGKLLWSYRRVANDIANIATPIIEGDYVFASSGYGTGAALLHLKALPEGAGVTAEEVYFLEADTFQNHHGGMILHEEHIFTGTGHNKGFPLVVKMSDGSVAWGPERNAGQSSAAISYADGRIYFRYQNGLMILVEATPAGYREHGSFMIPDVKRESWPHPVVANGRLYLREQDHLYAYDIAAAPPTGTLDE